MEAVLLERRQSFLHVEPRRRVVADQFAVGTAPKCSQVGDAIAEWPEFARQAKVSAAEVKRIRGQHQR